MKPNDDAVQVAALLTAQEFLSGLPADAPKAVRLYAESRVKALSGKKGRRKPTKAAKALPIPAPAISPAPPTRATIAPAPPAPVDALALARAKELVARNDELVKAALKAELVERLRSVRAQLAVKKPQLAVLVARIRQRDADGDSMDHNIAWRRARISALHHERSPVFDYLPGDPDATNWVAEVSRLEKECNAILATASALPNPYFLKSDAVNLQGEIQQLDWTQTNILNRLTNLEGRKFTTWGGRLVASELSGTF
jgi:hypothetical protein